MQQSRTPRISLQSFENQPPPTSILIWIEIRLLFKFFALNHCYQTVAPLSAENPQQGPNKSVRCFRHFWIWENTPLFGPSDHCRIFEPSLFTPETLALIVESHIYSPSASLSFLCPLESDCKNLINQMVSKAAARWWTIPGIKLLSHLLQLCASMIEPCPLPCFLIIIQNATTVLVLGSGSLFNSPKKLVEDMEEGKIATKRTTALHKFVLTHQTLLPHSIRHLHNMSQRMKSLTVL